MVASLAEVKSRSERYRVILADCPWQSAQAQASMADSVYYSALPLSELEALPVPEVADGKRHSLCGTPNAWKTKQNTSCGYGVSKTLNR